MSEDGSSSSSVQVITATSSSTRVTAVALASCSLLVVAVGAGGAGYHGSVLGQYGGGGGSGHVEWREVSVQGALALEVEVGEEGRSVVWGEAGELLLEAAPGEQGSHDGGVGFSGGGGWGSLHGGGGGTDGYDGGDGAGNTVGSGGRGSGEGVDGLPQMDILLG